MTVTCRFLILAAACLCLSRAYAGGKKEPEASVSFHMETEATDNPKMIFAQPVNGKIRHFRRMPEISTNDIEAFSPFPSDAGMGGYGLYLKLKPHAAKRLAAVTNMGQGRWLFSQVNGRPVDAVFIEKPVDDGILVIWKNVTIEDVGAMDDSFPRLGADGEKKKKKKD